MTSDTSCSFVDYYVAKSINCPTYECSVYLAPCLSEKMIQTVGVIYRAMISDPGRKVGIACLEWMRVSYNMVLVAMAILVAIEVTRMMIFKLCAPMFIGTTEQDTEPDAKKTE